MLNEIFYVGWKKVQGAPQRWQDVFRSEDVSHSIRGGHKNDDPNHKIIQNYSYPSKKSGSINVVSQHVYVVYHIQ